jgi:hypothetical protein
MASFVRHEPCPKCGSRDNLARYDDGSGWCFGCRLVIPSVRNSAALHASGILRASTESDAVRLPVDAAQDYPPHVIDWLKKYDIKVEEAIKHKWLYSPFWNQLIFPFYGQEHELLFWQGRNFTEGRKKYYSQGSPADLLPILRVGGNQLPTLETDRRQLVVVEDVVSAAKIARQTDSMPCLGSYLPARKLMRLRPFYEFLVFWLDADKHKEAMRMSDMAKWIGFRTKVVYTEKDPKEYSDTEIYENLSGN